jgi:hypothetical protein
MLGDRVIAPCDGIFFLSGSVYTHTPELRSLHLRGIDDAYPYKVALYYVKPDITIGTKVKQGDTIGEAQDVSGYWWKRISTLDEPWAVRLRDRGDRMTNHVHLELRVNGTTVDPTPHFMHVANE